jgi:5'-3' exoribonuclease 1
MGTGGVRERVFQFELVQGEQAKHVKEMEDWRKQAKLGMLTGINPYTMLTLVTVLTTVQREIFNKIKAFVMENRNMPLPSHYRAARLTMVNSFHARERVFITKLMEDLHLSVTWDEFDEEDRNLVTWRLPRALEDEPEMGEQKDGEQDSEWEDEDEGEDEESKAAVDRVLQKYEKAPGEDVDADGTFDERYERSVKEKMDEWKRGYYKVGILLLF